MSKKWVYLSDEAEEAEAYAGSWEGARGLLGGKGAYKAALTRLGVPALLGFVVTSEACNAYLHAGGEPPAGLWAQVRQAIQAIEKARGKRFGDPAAPLFFSCGASSRFSMPGMMDEILDIGLNDETAKALAALTSNGKYVYNLYLRLVWLFGSVILNIPDEEFCQAIEAYKRDKGVEKDTDLLAEDWQALVEQFKAIIGRHRAVGFPQDPFEQVKLAVEAAFRHWNSPRAVAYRNQEGISHDLGMAVSFSAWVYGNQGEDSGIGVVFTRNPATGEKVLYGAYMPHAHGPDWADGLRPTQSMAALAVALPHAYAQLVEACARLESHYRDMQDVAFRIGEGKLWIFSTRNGKRAAWAAVKIAVDMVDEGLISREEALLRVSPEHVDTLLYPHFAFRAKDQARQEGRYLTSGVNASPGSVVGLAVFDADLAEEWGKAGKDVILVRPWTRPDDVHGMLAAKGVLTQQGIATGNAAVVMRQFGIPAVVGCRDIEIDLVARWLEVKGKVVKEGEWLSIDGTTGELFLGQLATEAASYEEQAELQTLLAWADEICDREDSRGLRVWANADYPQDAQRARSLGAKGIGLCRTERMFFEEERLPIVQAMVLAGDVEERKAHLDKLLPYQRADFEGLFKAADGLPVVIRLLDPPLHEFLPPKDDLLIEVTGLRLKARRLEKKGKAKKLVKVQSRLGEKERLLQAVEGVEDSNPMLGLRGVRLYLTMPEIAQMQVRTILEAVCNQARAGVQVLPQIMIPMVSHHNELEKVIELLVPAAQEVMAEKGIEIDYRFGAMIETPRAALTAGQVAEHAEFFSSGSGDLTKMVFGMSRDDAERSYLRRYVEEGVLPVNPFQALDRDGVGELVRMAVHQGRQVCPELEIGVCGSQAAEPGSIEFFHLAGLDYVSCSPFRVPVARLAVARAALKQQRLQKSRHEKRILQKGQ
jgi:pyruvate,orthophosphate dikinase